MYSGEERAYGLKGSASHSSALSRSWKSQVREELRTFLNAQTILSNPFLPWSMEGRRSLISTTIEETHQPKFGLEHLALPTISALHMLSTSVLDGFSDKSTSLVIFLGKVEAKDTYNHNQLRVKECSRERVPSLREYISSMPGRPSESIKMFPESGVWSELIGHP